MSPLILLTFFIHFFSVKGVVLEAETRTPIAGASIQLKGSDRRVYSDFSGKFSMPDLPGGIQQLIISHTGYQIKEVAISDFAEGSNLEVLLVKELVKPQGNPDANNNNKPKPDKTKPQKDTADVFLSLDTTGIDIEQVVIRAIRADERTPITQSSLQKEDIEKSYIGQDMPLLLLQTPSVTAYSDNGGNTGYSYMRLRGIDPTRINMTLNGAPLNEPEDQGVYFSNFVDFGNSIESVQIQRGCGTSTNGMASYAGSINFESINLAKNKGGDIQVGYGSYNTYRASAEYATGILKNRLAFYSRFSLSGTDGYRYHSGNRSYSFFMSGGYFGERDLLKITAFSGIAHNNMAYLPTTAADIAIDPRTNYLNKDEKDHFTQHYVQAQYTRVISPRVDFTTTGYYSHIDGNYDLLAGDMFNLDLLSHFAGGFATVKYEGKFFEFTGGLHGNYFQRRHRMAMKPFVSDYFYSNVGQKMEGSAFVKCNWLIKPLRFYLDIQGRYARFNYLPDSASMALDFDAVHWWFFIPKAGLQVRLHPIVNLYASMGMTEREPTRTDLLGAYDDIDSTNYAEVGDFTRVRSERMFDWELGIQVRHPRFYLQVNGYYMMFQNEIAAIGQLNFFGIPLRKNVPSSFRAGAELEFNVKIVKGLVFSANACYNFHRIREYTTDYDSVTYTNVRPLLTPDVVVNAALEYQPFAWWSFAFSLRYGGGSFLDNTNNPDFKLPYHLVGDFRTSFQVKNHRLSVALNNFTNARYYMAGSVFAGQSAYYVQMPINFFVTYAFRF